MRVIVFFDLPMKTNEDLREYTKFRKFLIRDGFLMMQKSVYSKLALNQTAAGAVCDRVKAHCPAEGWVQILTITEKQFCSMEYVIGEKISDVMDSDERMIVL
ncbi:MAG: CRISPR-associated endonuclease Cas2 [Eubacteriaceae bacterium]|nr:CRISPR-associated endonuclease Cas2 [Eubacteriaceae bacterium]